MTGRLKQALLIVLALYAFAAVEFVVVWHLTIWMVGGDGT